MKDRCRTKRSTARPLGAGHFCFGRWIHPLRCGDEKAEGGADALTRYSSCPEPARKRNNPNHPRQCRAGTAPTIPAPLILVNERSHTGGGGDGMPRLRQRVRAMDRGTPEARGSLPRLSTMLRWDGLGQEASRDLFSTWLQNRYG
jgi:hypothetical protein